jgi:PAS domain S-box-containing protein
MFALTFVVVALVLPVVLGVAFFAWWARSAARIRELESTLTRFESENAALGQALGESERRYTLLVENAPDAIVVFDPEVGHFVDVNEAAIRLFECPRERLLTLGPADLSPEFQPDGRRSSDAAREYIQRALDGGIPRFSWTHCTLDRREFTSEIWLARLIKDGRHFIRGSVMDSSERSRSLEVIAQRDALIKSIVDNTPGMIYVKNLDGKYLLANRNFSETFGLPWDQIVGKSDSDIFPPEAARMYRENDLRVIESRSGIETEEPAYLGSNTHMFRTIKFPLVDDRGTLFAVCGISSDITARKMSEVERQRGIERESQQQALLLRIATHEAMGQGDVQRIAPIVTEEACGALGVARAGVWLLSETNPSILGCTDMYVKSSGQHVSGDTVDLAQFPAYATELFTVRCRDTFDSRRDPRTSELAESYLIPAGVTSMLEAPIRSGGKALGIVCFEHVGPCRAWLPDEIAFAAEVADQVGQAFSNSNARENERRLQRIEELYRRAIKAAGAVPYLQIYGQEQYGYLGENVEALTGYTVNEFTSKVLDKITIDYVTRGTGSGIDLDKAVKLARSGKMDIWQCDYKIVTKSGDIRWIADAAVENLNEVGVSTGSIGLFADITDRMETEEHLRYQVKALELIATISSRFVNVGHDEIDLEITRALEELAALTRVDRSYLFLWEDEGSVMTNTHEWCAPGIASFIGELKRIDTNTYPWFSERISAGVPIVVSRVEDLPGDADAEKSEYEREGVRSIILVPVTFAGKTAGFIGIDSVREERRWSNETPSLLRIAGEIFFNAIGRKRGEDERQNLEQQIRHTQKLESLGVLAGGIAHDFNNLLVAILGNADLALQDLPSHSGIRDYILDIETASRRAADLCRQMLAYSGKGRFVVEPLDLAQLVHEMASMLEVSISKKASIKYNFGTHVLPVVADATQLRQVVMNLITNASESLQDGSGVIAVNIGSDYYDSEYLAQLRITEDLAPGNYVYLEVTDTGCGMDEETQNRMFDPFFTTKFTGRGLGMAAVLGIVRGHKGAIKLYSELGKGTSIRVIFPATVDRVAGDTVSSVNAEKWTPDGTILFVDDEETVRHTGQKMLQRLGFKVLLAKDGKEAVEIYQMHRDLIACCIVDLTMPKMDGEETLHALRAIDENVRVILSSGYNEQELAERFSGIGLSGFMEKPYLTGKLETKLREVLAR